MPDRLQQNQQLNVNDQLVPPNGRTNLVMQGDGNLVLYRNAGGPLWASNTVGKGVNRAVMQGDGNFVCYDANNRAFWATGTDNHPGSYVVLQDDGNLVVYSPNNTPLWATNTVQNFDPLTTDTGDTSVGTGNHMESWASMASTGLIFGHTRTWCNVDLRGFHGSVVAVLYDANAKAVWPPNPQVTKHQYGVDGVWTGTHDRTAYWANQADPAVLAQAHSLGCINFYDPKNMLLTDIPIILKTAEEIATAIVAIAAA